MKITVLLVAAHDALSVVYLTYISHSLPSQSALFTYVRCGCCLGCRLRFHRWRRILAGVPCRCSSRTRHTLIYLPTLLSRHTHRTQHSGSSHSPLSPLHYYPPSIHQLHHRHSSLYILLCRLLGLRHWHCSLTLELHLFPLHLQGRKYLSTRRDTMRGSRVSLRASLWGIPTHLALRTLLTIRGLHPTTLPRHLRHPH
jgi:hypothetical protein